MLKKSLLILVVMVLMYVCCKWPDEVVFVCEFGFTILGSMADAVVEGVKGLVAGSSTPPVV